MQDTSLFDCPRRGHIQLCEVRVVLFAVDLVDSGSLPVVELTSSANSLLLAPFAINAYTFFYSLTARSSRDWIK